jgi:hypothetical protein
MSSENYYWDEKLEHLLLSRKLYHYYLQFLVSDVWKIENQIENARSISSIRRQADDIA